MTAHQRETAPLDDMLESAEELRAEPRVA